MVANCGHSATPKEHIYSAMLSRKNPLHIPIVRSEDFIAALDPDKGLGIEVPADAPPTAALLRNWIERPFGDAVSRRPVARTILDLPAP